MPYQPIVATLGYVLARDGERVLMVHRNAREDDHQYGKFNGLGGKMQDDEDVASCMRREIFEEAGIVSQSMSLRGTISWPGFGPKGEDWLGFIFLITEYEGEPFEYNAEGTLEWVPVSGLASLNLWDGDRHFLPMVFDGDPMPFHGVMPYRDGELVSWSFSR